MHTTLFQMHDPLASSAHTPASKHTSTSGSDAPVQVCTSANLRPPLFKASRGLQLSRMMLFLLLLLLLLLLPLLLLLMLMKLLLLLLLLLLVIPKVLPQFPMRHRKERCVVLSHSRADST